MTSIEWTDVTWNPTDGCSLYSPGCANCYAMRFAGRFSNPGERYHGLVSIGKNKRAIWTGDLRLDSGKLAKPLTWKKPRRVFVNSMSDLFHENLTNEQIAAVFGVMAACPQHTFQILTKRAKRMREWFEWIVRKEPIARPRAIVWAYAFDHLKDQQYRGAFGRGVDIEERMRPADLTWPLSNVWIGVSVENQAAAEDRIPELLATPAALRFLSCEPLLELVDLFAFMRGGMRDAGLRALGVNGPMPGIDWVIAGCESGPGARPCQACWLEAMCRRCSTAGVPFFLKQAKEQVAPLATDGSHEDRIPMAIGFGPGSTRKAGGVIGLPYLHGKQYAEMPR